MKTQKPNAELVWKQFTDFLTLQYRLTITDRAVYWHLVRHSRLEGKPRLHFSIAWLARGSGLTATPARQAVRRLASHGILRMLERSKKGHLIEVRLPSEVRIRPSKRGSQQVAVGKSAPPLAQRGRPRGAMPDIGLIDGVQTPALRSAIYARDRGICFYCLRQLNNRTRCLDHVIPRVRGGHNSYRNLVSSCVECNSLKRDTSAADHFRRLYRERRLTTAELSSRLRALKSLASGKLRPVLS